MHDHIHLPEGPLSDHFLHREIVQSDLRISLLGIKGRRFLPPLENLAALLVYLRSKDAIIHVGVLPLVHLLGKVEFILVCSALEITTFRRRPTLDIFALQPRHLQGDPTDSLLHVLLASCEIH